MDYGQNPSNAETYIRNKIEGKPEQFRFYIDRNTLWRLLRQIEDYRHMLKHSQPVPVQEEEEDQP